MGRGKHQASLDLVEASYGILQEIQPATVRAVCYRLFVAKIIPDMRTASTARVSRQLTWARENDHIPWEWIVDETRTPERVSSWDDPKSFMRSVKRCYRKDLWREQPHDVEVWSETAALSGLSWRSMASRSVCSTGSPAPHRCTRRRVTASGDPSRCSTSAMTRPV